MIINALLLLLFSGQLCVAFLDNTQISYIRKILTHPHTPEYMRNQTQQVLFNEYQPWLNKQVRLFKEKQKINKAFSTDLHHYAALGLLDAIRNFEGKSSLVKYAEKYVDGKMRIGLLELTPLQPLNHYQTYIKRSKIQKPTLVSYDNYWVFDKEPRQNVDTKPPRELSFILSCVFEMPDEYSTLFFSRYDSLTLAKIDSVGNICSRYGFSRETYRKKMNEVKKYIQYRK